MDVSHETADSPRLAQPRGALVETHHPLAVFARGASDVVAGAAPDVIASNAPTVIAS